MSRLVACLLLVFLWGCNHKGYIVVKVESNIQLHEVAKLRGAVTHDKVTRNFELSHTPAVDIPPQQSFAIEVPPEVTGLLQLHLEAIHTDGSVLAEGDAQGLVQDGRLTVVFGGGGGDGGRDLAKPNGGDGGIQDLAVPPGADSAGSADDLSAVPACPNIMVMVDYTGSMATTIPDGGSLSKMQAQVNAVNTVVAEFGSRVPIGLVSYASPGTCSQGVNLSPEPMTGNQSLIAGQLSSLVANGTGNNDVALQRIQADTFFQQRGPSYVIMITDNAPNCPAPGVSGSDPVTTAAAANAAMALFAGNFPVYVIGFEMVADPAALDTIAQAGGVPCSGPTCAGRQYWPVGDTTGLATQLRAIFNQVANGCAN